MDHSLEDPLSLESAMTVDFEPPSDETNTQSDINLESNNPETNISMEYELDEQPILMDTENEEIIDEVDFMGDQITLQEYPNTEDQSVTITTSQANTSIFTSQPEIKIEMPTMSQLSVQEIKTQPKYITVKAALPRMATKKVETATLPRQVAIAPKPAKVVHGTIIPKAGLASGQCAIAPKPITLVTNRPTSSFIKKPIVGQGNLKQNTVFAKIGNQIVMVPSEGGQKYKLVSASGGMPVQYIKSEAKQTQMILPKTVSGLSGIQNKPVLAKLVIAGNAGATTGRIVTVQPKTVPITVNNKVLVTSPTKQALKIAPKQHVVALKSPTKLVTTSPGTTSKKVVITTNPANMIMKTIVPKTTQVIKEVNAANVQSAPKTQLYQINVPGKGVQYIRLVSSQGSKPANVKPQSPVSVSSKAKVLMDTKGNVIQVPANKMVTSQATTPLMVTGQTTSVNTVPTKSIKTYFRIAPVAKPQQAIMNKSVQSLLAPITPEKSSERESEKAEEQMESESRHSGGSDLANDSKEVLREMLADSEVHEHEVEIEFEGPQQQRQPSASPPRSECEENNPLIVIGGAFREQPSVEASGDDTHNVYQNNSHLDAADALSSEYGLRPRKACNCTKSQCLKLYCDCFANGEFCNKCNCNNCFNNLENEEYRQKAIRGCLERNPNAFKPKIGKTKDGGPEIVRRHNKGCNCKKSGCLKNYCECYEAKIACTAMCKCVGCRNVEETLERTRRRQAAYEERPDLYRPPSHAHLKHPCNFLTGDVIEAVCQCLIAVAVDNEAGDSPPAEPVRNVIEEFSRCLQDIISAAHHSPPLVLLNEERA